MKTTVSACLETLFVDAGSYENRIEAAVDAGCNAVEIWFPGGKDSRSLTAALSTSQVPLRLMLAGPVLDITEAANKEAFLNDLKTNLSLAREFDTETLIVQSGNEIPSMSRESQLINLRSALEEAADIAEAAGIILLFEPLNTVVDHKGYFADDSLEAFTLIRDIGSPSLRILLDLYHASVMGEDPVAVLKGNLGLVSHMHIADAPGRHEPGSGKIDYPGIFKWIHDEGYNESFGLEYFPAGPSKESVEHVLSLLNNAGFTF